MYKKSNGYFYKFLVASWLQHFQLGADSYSTSLNQLVMRLLICMFNVEASFVWLKVHHCLVKGLAAVANVRRLGYFFEA